MDQYTYIHTGDFNLTTMAALTMERSSHVDTLLSRWQLMLLLFLLGSCSAQSTYYVTPTPNTPCPRESCHTLSEYVAGQFFSNLPVNTAMEFLPGNHTLEQTISVTNVTWLTLHGDSSFLPEVTSRIECTWPAGFVFTNITELYISAMAFISCGHHNSAAILIISIQHSNISKAFHKNAKACRAGFHKKPTKQDGTHMTIRSQISIPTSIFPTTPMHHNSLFIVLEWLCVLVCCE